MLMKPRYYVGADVGGTKTHLLLSDETGQVKGFAQAGPGNHEVVGYDGLIQVLSGALSIALPADISIDQIAGAGFGIGGFDFPSETQDTYQAIAALGLKSPVKAVNDTILGLLAGSEEGWGIAVVSGTGCNCWGWDRTRTRVGRVTGHGMAMGEGAGGSELVEKAVQALCHEWTQRGPKTQLTPAFIRYTGARNLEDMIEGLALEWYTIQASAAPIIFDVAANGDPVAKSIIHWAGCELGELANSVIRQLDFQSMDFDVVLVGSMFEGGEMLIEPMKNTITSFSPGARLVKLKNPPVIGAVMLGMEEAGMPFSPEIRQKLSATMVQYIQDSR